MERGPKPKLKMLFAGGCHIFGHPLGEAYSFTAVAASRLSDVADVQIETFRVGLKRSASILEVLKRERFDVLVVQLGNFECPVGVQRHFRQWLGRPKKSRSARDLARDSSSAKLALDPEMVFAPTLRWHIASLARSLYDRVATVLRHPLFEPEPFRVALRELLQQVAALDLPCVIAIAPLPCADRAFLRHRRHGGAVMRQEAEAAGVLYLDSVKALNGPGGRIEDAMYAETAHLSREGQRVLGEALAALVEKQLPPRG
jgi:hypothetical protein